MAWLAVAVVVIAGFWLPVVIAAVRGTERIGLVILLTLLTFVAGVTWFAALAAACTLPRARLRPPRQACPLPGSAADPASRPFRPPAYSGSAWR